MAAKRDYYEVLGIKRDADDAAIKKAYRKLAKKYHPDSNGGDAQAEQKFKEVTEAYTILSDPEKRKLYDRFGHAAFDGTGAAAEGAGNFDGFYGFGGNGGFGSNGNFRGFRGFTGGSGANSGSGSSGGYQEYHFEGNMDDIFDDLFGGMFGSGSSRGTSGRGAYGEGTSRSGSSGGRGFGGSSGRTGFDWSGFAQDGFAQGGFNQGSFNRDSYSGGRGFGGGTSGQKGRDLNADVSVTFDEAAFGCDKVIRLQREDGSVQSLQVHIPAGIETGKSIRLRGKGMPGLAGAPAGDLLLKVTVGEKPGFERRGMDVYSTVSIPFATAVLGGEAMVQTIHGAVMCKIKAGTQSGSKIRLKGKGIVSMSDPSRHGDHYVTVQIQVPVNLGSEAKEKLREFQDACNREQRWTHGAA